jgi:hypothetical protein
MDASNFAFCQEAIFWQEKETFTPRMILATGLMKQYYNFR